MYITPTGPYFSVLRAAIWQKPVDTSHWPETVDWDPILDNYKAQALLTVASSALMNIPEPYSLSQEQSDRAIVAVVKNMRAHDKIQRIYSWAQEILERNNIHPILLKGEELASRYPFPEHRPCGDIDFYVCKEDSERARNLLLQNGAEMLEEHQIHHTLTYDDILLEIHHHLGKIRVSKSLSKRLNDLLIKEISHQLPEEKQLTQGLRARCLSPYSNLLFNYGHLVSHIIDGIGLRQFVDQAILLHDMKLQDLTKFKTDIQRLGLYHCWQKCAGIMVDYLGLPQDECPFYKPLTNTVIIPELIDHGNFSFHSSNQDSYDRNGFIRGLVDHYHRNKLLRQMLPMMAVRAEKESIVKHLRSARGC